MIEVLSSVALVAAISLGHAAPVAFPVTTATSLTRAALMVYPRATAAGATARLQQPVRKDSLKNGAIIGAVAGGLAFALLGSVGCAYAAILSGESDCAGPLSIITAAGAGVGALIGVGVDALFERAPQTAGSPAGIRKGVRLRVRF